MESMTLTGPRVGFVLVEQGLWRNGKELKKHPPKISPLEFRAPVGEAQPQLAACHSLLLAT